MTVDLRLGDCRDVLKTLASNSIDSIVTDGPYELGFMGKSWDNTGVVNDKTMWAECLRVLKPGGYLLSFGGSRTYRRMACAIEDAGFEIRDQIMWCYAQGFPKSLNIGKAVDKLQGNEREVVGNNPNFRPVSGKEGYLGQSNFRQTDGMSVSTKGTSEWEGWGTALKPAVEPICMARKPLEKGLTVAESCLKWGVGGINIDACRVGIEERTYCGSGAQPNKLNNHAKGDTGIGLMDGSGKHMSFTVNGRFPANFIHDGSEEVVDLFPNTQPSKGGYVRKTGDSQFFDQMGDGNTNPPDGLNDSGSAARFFYCAKASTSERSSGLLNKNFHPTVKPVKLMEYLVTMVTPKGGTVLDPFMGSGTTGVACKKLDFNFIGCEMSAEYMEIAKARIGADVVNTQDSSDVADNTVPVKSSGYHQFNLFAD
jgi:site-specific DNA-methyltransferase (adenine-specific)